MVPSDVSVSVIRVTKFAYPVDKPELYEYLPLVQPIAPHLKVVAPDA